MLREFWNIVWGLLREISDEAPYARYLAHHGLKASPEAYRRFADMRLKGKYQRGKCC